jgi:hypothetical protein
VQEKSLMQGGELNTWSSLALWMSGSAWTLVVVLVLAVAAGVLAYLRREKKPQLRIKIHGKERLKIGAAGIRNCPSCWQPLKDDEPLIWCLSNPEHVIHADCRELAGGKCPRCKANLV